LLYTLYDNTKGKPTKALLKQTANQLGLKAQQVYKWFWDIKKKKERELLGEDSGAINS
jgi:hypothetical protein